MGWVISYGLIGLQIVAFFPYWIGSRRFYLGKEKFMQCILLGFALDCIIISTPMWNKGSMVQGHGAPWNSLLFLLHVGMASIGMFGFAGMLVYLFFKGRNHEYPRLRKFQYRVLLPMWVIGVSIALISFAAKVAFGVRLYDLL